MLGSEDGSAESEPLVEPRSLPSVDVLVATYQSADTLAESLASALEFLPVHCLLVVDRASTDATQEIARRFGARVLVDEVGLGSARNLALRNADTDPVLFLDSDVRIVRPDFYPRALEEYARARTAAVVGESVGYSFHYGLPLGLTLIGRDWTLSAEIPDRAQGRETYYLQRAARRERRVVRYVRNSMVHRGTYRRAAHWAEFQGAAIRRSSGLNPREILYAAEVVLLMHMNSKRPSYVLYSPVFFAKILRGFLAPERWERLDRRQLPIA